MTAADTPDGVRGAATALQVIGSFPAATHAATVTLPSNAVALWLLLGPAPSSPPVTVVGVTTGTTYPVYQLPLNVLGGANVPSLALVAPELDQQVAITWLSGPADHWYVIADAGPRITVDPVLAASAGPAGVPPPGWAVQVAGTDGTDLRALLTDSSGRLETVGSAFPAVYGAPGSPPPADALLVAGTDGTDLRALLTDSSGRLETVGSAFPAVYGAPGSPPPADALLVAGTDGTDLRALLTNSGGYLLVIDQNLDDCISFTTTAAPAVALQVAGTDGTNLEALRTNKNGVQYAIPTAPSPAAGDHPPVEVQFASLNSNASPGTLVAAPGAGERLRVFSVSVMAGTGAASNNMYAYDSVTSVKLVQIQPTSAAAMYGTLSGYPSGIPLATNAALEVAVQAVGDYYFANVVYTVETI